MRTNLYLYWKNLHNMTLFITINKLKFQELYKFVSQKLNLWTILAISMMETVYVGGNFEMLVTDFYIGKITTIMKPT